MRLPVPAKSYAVLIGTSTYRDGELAADRCAVVPDPADVRTA